VPDISALPAKIKRTWRPPAGRRRPPLSGARRYPNHSGRSTIAAQPIRNSNQHMMFTWIERDLLMQAPFALNLHADQARL
jgi:hypothetical protein